MEEGKSSNSFVGFLLGGFLFGFFFFLPNHLSMLVAAAVPEVAEPGNDSS